VHPGFKTENIRRDCELLGMPCSCGCGSLVVDVVVVVLLLLLKVRRVGSCNWNDGHIERPDVKNRRWDDRYAMAAPLLLIARLIF